MPSKTRLFDFFSAELHRRFQEYNDLKNIEKNVVLEINEENPNESSLTIVTCYQITYLKQTINIFWFKRDLRDILLASRPYTSSFDLAGSLTIYKPEAFNT